MKLRQTLVSGSAKVVAATCVVVIAGGAATALALGRRAHRAATNDPPRVTAVGPRLRNTIGIFRRASVGHDVIPTDVLSTLAPLLEKAGGNPALARWSPASIDGQGTYVIPGNGFLCFFGSGLGGCDTTQRLASTGIAWGIRAGGDLPAGTIQLQGVVPDGVSKVVVRLVDGGSATATVTDNAFSAEVGQAPMELEAGSHQVPISVPPEFLHAAPPGGYAADRVGAGAQ